MEAFGLLLHGFAVRLTWKTLALMLLFWPLVDRVIARLGGIARGANATNAKA